MTTVEPLLTVGDIHVYPDDRGGLEAISPVEVIGYAWPRKKTEPDGMWFARRRGHDARAFDSRDEAVAHITGADI